MFGFTLTKWQAARRERQTTKLTARAASLGEDEDYDLIFLHQKGFVRARGTGQSITQIHAEVESLIRQNLHIVIRPGTYFVAAGSHQNMVTRTDYSFTLSGCSTKQLTIAASCINADRPIPAARDRFYGVARVSADLVRFLEAANNADPMVIQAGVWALTDGYSKSDIQQRLVVQDQYGNTRRAVSDAHIEEAKRLLNTLGIRHRL